jgi:AraC-like DNA-binding protein
MSVEGYHAGRERTLWRVWGFGQGEVVAPGMTYWYENLGRKPDGLVIAQFSLEGRIVYRERKQRTEVPAGSLLLFAYDEDTAYGRPPEWREAYHCDHVALRGAGLVEHWSVLRRRFGSILPLRTGSALHEQFLRLCETASPQAGAEAIVVATAVHGFVMRIYQECEETLAAGQSPVERAVDDLLRHPTYPWSLKEVAQRHGCSREYLARVFHQRMGTPPGKHLARSRLERAVALLRETHLPLATIAAQSGFSSTHTLARCIRQATGHAPSHLRPQVKR